MLTSTIASSFLGTYISYWRSFDKVFSLRVQLLRQHGLYVSLRIILFKGTFGRLGENEFVLDLVSVHLVVEKEGSL